MADGVKIIHKTKWFSFLTILILLSYIVFYDSTKDELIDISETKNPITFKLTTSPAVEPLSEFTSLTYYQSSNTHESFTAKAEN